MSGLPDLHVNAAGLCCSLGYHLDAAVCALRANMDHFRESAFYSQGGDPVQVAWRVAQVRGEPRDAQREQGHADDPASPERAAQDRGALHAPLGQAVAE